MCILLFDLGGSRRWLHKISTSGCGQVGERENLWRRGVWPICTTIVGQPSNDRMVHSSQLAAICGVTPPEEQWWRMIQAIEFPVPNKMMHLHSILQENDAKTQTRFGHNNPRYPTGPKLSFQCTSSMLSGAHGISIFAQFCWRCLCITYVSTVIMIEDNRTLSNHNSSLQQIYHSC